MKNMNLPNKLTIARIIATPVFLFFLLFDFPFHYFLAMLIFIAAALTDLFDGKYARKHNLVTDFGKFLDPLADKMLTTAAFIGFLAKNIGGGMEWILFIVLFREFMVSSIRLIAVSSGGKVIAANKWGKLKTVSQMTAIIYTLFAAGLTDLIRIPLLSAILGGVAYLLLWISAILCIVSGAIYLKDNFSFLDPEK